MVSRVFRLLRSAKALFTAAGSPRQIAFGVALGMMIGLVPKGNMTALLLLLVLLATHANLAAGLAAAALFSWVGMWTDRLAHLVGLAVLKAGPVQPVGAWLYDVPLAPWTALNNTVVLGSLLLGLVLFYPVYHLSYLFFDRHRDRIAGKLRRYRAAVLPEKSEPATQWRPQ